MYQLDRYLGPAPRKLQRAIVMGQPLRPLSVKIKLTWHCNLACLMCADWRIQGARPPRPNYFDSWEKLRALLEELMVLKAKKFHFSGGEPLMNPYLEQAVHMLASQGRHVSLVSNGTLWSRGRAEALIAAGLSQVTFSLDSPEAETFARLRGRDTWEQLRQGIRNAASAAAGSQRLVRLKSNTVVTRHNFRQLRELPDLAHELGIQRIRFLPVDDLHATADLRLSLAEIQEFNQEIAPVVLEKALRYQLVNSPLTAYPFGYTRSELEYSAQGLYARGLYKTSPCYVPWLHTLIGADGRVHGCCMLKGEKIAFGHLGQQSFTEIWRGPAYQAFRERMQQGQPYSICHHCDNFLAENRYLNTLLAGSVLKPVPAGI